MPIRAHIQYESSPDAMKKELNAAAKEGNSVAVEFWHEHFRGQHFTVEGGRKYGYQPRKGDNTAPRVAITKRRADGSTYTTYRANRSYSWRKRREKGHNKPLVWEGRSRNASESVRITASARQAAGVYSMPRYWYQYRKDLGQPDKAAEFTKVLPSEGEAMGGAAQAAMVEHLNKIRAPKTVTA